MPGQAHIAEPGAAPNGSPATRLGNFEVMEGAPSVSWSFYTRR
jgi:hypothetical protein